MTLETINRAALLAGPAVIAVLVVVMGGWTGDEMPHLGLEAIITLLSAAPLVLAWFVAAAGLGWPLRLWLMPRSSEPAAMQLAMGVAAMLVLDSALGRLGLLQFGGSLGAWAPLLLGFALLFEQLRRTGLRREAKLPTPHWIIWAASPAIAVLLIATTSAPGWLWDTEYGGYDALSYHLQLPKEWLALGGIVPVERNVYSFFPGAMEAAFYHVMVLRGDAIDAVYACQLLHGAMVVITAWTVGRMVHRAAERSAVQPAPWVGAAAFIVLLGTPWIVVVGSLAYNEMPMLLMLAAGLLAIAEKGSPPVKRAIAIGMFASVACLAKLTAIGFVAVPLGVLLLLKSSMRAWPKAVIAASITGLIVLAPYLIHNAAMAGNPIFPFATGVLGSGHWSDEQAAIWREAHRSELPAGERIAQAWHQLARFGIGPRPTPEEPWHPQWSLLPWLGMAALAILLVRRSTAGWGMKLLIVMVIQVMFWITLTHIKSRFMLPLAVPGAVAIALSLSSIARKPLFEHLGMKTLAAALLLWSFVPVYVFMKQAGGAPAARIGMAQITSGEALTAAMREQAARADSPVIFMNFFLPESSRVLFVGEAAPLYHMGDFAYNTVWDRGPLSRLMREHPEDPRARLEALRDAGFTHVYADPVMLNVWEEAGWNDPLLTLDRIMMTMQAGATPLHRWPRGEMLFALVDD